MRVGSLFSGIGGLDLGLERAGMHVVWQCEIDSYCRGVLARHWPGVKCYEDVRDIDESAQPVELICGGFPCQPVSGAGRGLAQQDPRWIWPEFARVVGLLRPRYVLVENVPGLVRRGLADVVGDLAALGYDAEWFPVSAGFVGAPHVRRRLFLVAHPEGIGWQPWWGDSIGLAVRDAERPSEADSGPWATEPCPVGVAYGVPGRVGQLRALGNAVVPQVAEFVGRLILEGEAARA